MPRSPRILIPAAATDTPPARYQVNRTYVRAIEQAGGLPIIVTRPSVAEIQEYLGCADGLLLLGGADVAPERYGKANCHGCGPVNPIRDETEFALIEAADRANLPILGICRGMQVLNVARGGTLISDIATEVPNTLRHDGSQKEETAALLHEVQFQADSRIARAIGRSSCPVNSLHHQAVLQLGADLRVSGQAPDGIIEAIEGIHEGRFILGVQWHPEEFDDEQSQAIFGAFIAAARERA